ncbi:MAG: hypothetical protein RLZZ628_929 [Bacteroidota bacterium]|jgi:hypothetical protein
MSKSEQTEAGAQSSNAKELPLPDRETALSIIDNYDGFNELLAPLADNLEVFAPKATKKKKKFLHDEGATAERQQLRDRLQAFKDLLAHPDAGNHKQLRQIAQEKLDQNESLVHKNLGKITDAARDLEQTYRELALFYQNAQPQKVKNLTLLNLNKDVLLDPDSKVLYAELERRLLVAAERVDQKKAYSLLVIPKLWQSKQPKNLIEQYAKLAGASRLQFLTDFADTDTIRETLKERENPRWQGICGSEAFHSHLTLFTNHLVLRHKDEAIGEEEDLRGSPTMALAGKMYAEKISQPVAGEKHGSVSGHLGIAYDPTQPQVADLSDEGLNSMMHAYEKDMAYEAATAFNGSEYALKRYAVVRVMDYVNRVLRHYLGKVTFQQLDREKSNHVRDTIQDFLDQLAEQKIIAKGKVENWGWNPRTPDRIDLDISILPLWAVRTFVYALSAVEGKKTDVKEK